MVHGRSRCVDDPAERGRFIAALRRKTGLWCQPERLATPDKNR
jgi:hypothetical protein